MSSRFAFLAMIGLAAVPAQAQAQAQTAGDPVAGQKQFGQCRVCHQTERTKPDGVGPNLFGSYGSVAGTRRPKFAYSPALKASKLVWNDANLDRWIADSAGMVKGSKMHFIGIARKPTRANIIAYMKTLK